MCINRESEIFKGCCFQKKTHKQTKPKPKKKRKKALSSTKNEGVCFLYQFVLSTKLSVLLSEQEQTGATKTHKPAGSAMHFVPCRPKAARGPWQY